MASKLFMRSLCFLLLSTNVISAPSQRYNLNERDDNTAGIGVELEWRGCEMVNLNPALKPPTVTDAQITQIKGTGVVIKDNSNALNGVREWKMTAEHFGQEDTDGIYKIVPEFIVDGQIVKVGENKLEQIGTNIMNFLGVWLPQKAHDSAVLVPGFEQFGTWNVERPVQEYSDINTPGLVTFGTQYTAAMPLAGIHACFMHAKNLFPTPDPMDEKKNPLIPDMELNTRNMHLVEAKHVDPKDKKGTVDLSPESLGFFSIVVSYAKAAANGKVNPDKGIKHTIPIMPRTDFAKLYKDYVEDNLKQVFDTDACDYSLYNVVKKLSEYKGDGSDVKNFDSSKLDTEPIKWNSGLVPKASLKIEEWMDGLQYWDIDKISELDKTIDGQIGGYGRKTEKLYSSSVSAPLFEFRDLTTNGKILPQQLKTAEEAVKSFHQTYNSAPRKLRYRQAKSSSKAGACTRKSTSKSQSSTKSDAGTKTNSASETTKSGTTKSDDITSKTNTVMETGTSKSGDTTSKTVKETGSSKTGTSKTTKETSKSGTSKSAEETSKSGTTKSSDVTSKTGSASETSKTGNSKSGDATSKTGTSKAAKETSKSGTSKSSEATSEVSETSKSGTSKSSEATSKPASVSETSKTGTSKTAEETSKSGTSKTSDATSKASDSASKTTKDSETASKTGTISPSATQNCPEGKKPSKDGKDCVTKPDADTKGKCADGKILDPAEGGQTKDTEKPVCIDEPGCKDDEVPSQPLYKPVAGAGSANCVKKPDDDKPCEKGQYKLYKAGGDGKATGECVDTRKTADEKKKAADAKKAEEDKKKKEEEDKKKEQEKKDNELKEKKKSRGRFCMALVASSELLPPEDIPGEDDIKDAAEDAWPKDLEYKEIEMSNSNIEKGRNSVSVGAIEMETAGPNFGAIFKAIFGGGGKSAAKAAAETTVEAAAKLAAQTAKYAVKAGRNSAKAGESLKKIKDHPSFAECLAAIPTWVENNKLHLGGEVPPGGFKAQAEGPYLHMWDSEDGGGSNPESYMNRQNWNDDFFHADRLKNDECLDLNFYNDKVTAFDAHKTCCTFYRDKGCKDPMFAAFDREDGELTGKENDAISSIMCTESGCGGHPK